MATAIAFAGRGPAEGGGMKIAFRSLPHSAPPLLTPSRWLQLLLPPHSCPRAESSLGSTEKGAKEVGCHKGNSGLITAQVTNHQEYDFAVRN